MTRTENRAFKTSRRPVTAASHALIADVRSIVLAEEAPRKRARKAADVATFNATLSALIADLSHRSIETLGHGWLRVPRSKQVVGCGDPILTAKFPSILDTLFWASLTEEDRGRQSRDKAWQIQSRVRAAPRLLDMIEKHGVEFDDLGRTPIDPADMLVMRSGAEPGDWTNRSKRDLPLPITSEVERLRREMEAVNGVFRSASLEVLHHRLDDTERGLPDPGERCAYRIFSDDLSRGGRLYGPFWLAMSKDERREAIRIDGEPVLGLDYGQMGLRTLYAWAAQEPPKGDLYDIPGLEGSDREGRKALVSALISSGKTLRKWPKATKALFPPAMSVGHAVDRVKVHHKAISGEFLKGAWGGVQRAESDIIVSVVLQCADRGITALPIHDGVIVPRSGASTAEAIMLQAFKDRLSTDQMVEIKRDEDEQPPSLAA